MNQQVVESSRLGSQHRHFAAWRFRVAADREAGAEGLRLAIDYSSSSLKGVCRKQRATSCRGDFEFILAKAVDATKGCHSSMGKKEASHQ